MSSPLYATGNCLMMLSHGMAARLPSISSTPWAGRHQVIIIDAVRTGSEPGTIFRFTLKDISSSREQVTSLHQVGLLETVNVAEHLSDPAPKEIDWGLELSAEVEATVSKAIELVIQELEDFERKENPTPQERGFLDRNMAL